MREELMTFAREFDGAFDHTTDDRHGLRGIHHPLVLVFVGDKAAGGLKEIRRINRAAWNNSGGVVYLYAGAGELKAASPDAEEIFTLGLPVPGGGLDRRTARSDLYRQFYADKERLAEMNGTIRRLSNRIADQGPLYASLQQLDIAVVTRADDPCSVLVPEITLLVKNILGESFKQVRTDLYTLLQERVQEEEYAYSTALGVSFLRELDACQSRDYRFSARLRATVDGIHLPVEHGPAPLFDLVYLLGEKNERGLLDRDGIKTNYAIICRLSLLKNNRLPGGGQGDDPGPIPGSQPYNNQDYQHHIRSSLPLDSGGVYSSAGWSRVTRPNTAIALTVLGQLLQYALARLKEQSALDRRSILELWGMEGEAVSRRAEGLVPEAGLLEEMNALLSAPVSYGELKRLPLEQAEEELFGRHAGDFFRRHFADEAERKLAALDLKQEVRQRVWERIIGSPKHGLYCAWVWTSKEEGAVILQELEGRIRETARDADEARQRLDRQLQETVDMQPFPKAHLFSERNVKRFCRYYFETVYGKRRELLVLELRLSYLKALEEAVAHVNGEIGLKYGGLLDLEREIKEASRRSVSESDDYLGRNIPEYYAAAVADIMNELAARRGPSFLFEDRFLGNVAEGLEAGCGQLLARLMEVCRRDIFTSAVFRQSFEEELLERANVTVPYSGGGPAEGVLSKEELFRDLYNTLEEQSTARIEVYNYTHKHRYEEQYYFGDAGSEFIKHAFAADSRTRTYKLGCVHEERSSGLEKLLLMGGFLMDDVLYVRNGMKYYEGYASEGFLFHPPELAEKLSRPRPDAGSAGDSGAP